MTKNQLKSLILDDFKFFFESNCKNQLKELQNKVSSNTFHKLKLSDIIMDETKERNMNNPSPNKTLIICPLCKKQIKGSDINFEKIDITQIKNFPFAYVHIHSNKKNSPHAILLYFDAQLKIRGKKVAKFTNIRE
jgi:hypothetical protein